MIHFIHTNFGKSLLWIFSRFPIFSTTLDKNFHQIDKQHLELNSNGKLSIEDLEPRFSFLSFGFGNSKIYLITYKYDFNEKKLKFYEFKKIIKLEDISKLPSEELVNKKVNTFAEHLSSINDSNLNDINSEIDLLKYKISQSENRINIQISKVNIYNAITVVILPILIPLIINILSKSNTLPNLSLKILALSILYIFLNIILLIFNFIKVKERCICSFSDLKTSTDKLRSLAKSYYKEFYSLQDLSNLYVSYVTNIERYFKLIMVTFSILLIVTNFNFRPISIKKDINHSNIKNIYIEDISIKKNNLKDLLTIQNMLIESNLNEIIIIVNPKATDDISVVYEKVKDTLNLYNFNKIPIKEISDYSQNNNYIKFILIKKEE